MLTIRFEGFHITMLIIPTWVKLGMLFFNPPIVILWSKRFKIFLTTTTLTRVYSFFT